MLTAQDRQPGDQHSPLTEPAHGPAGRDGGTRGDQHGGDEQQAEQLGRLLSDGHQVVGEQDGSAAAEEVEGGPGDECGVEPPGPKDPHVQRGGIGAQLPQHEGDPDRPARPRSTPPRRR